MLCTHRHLITNIYETVDDPKTKQVVNTPEVESNYQTASQNEHDYHDTPTPPLPPRGYSLSSSLDKIDNFENMELQDLGSQLRQERNPETNDENTYQPLIPPRPSDDANAASEYQSLKQLTQCKNTQPKGYLQRGQEVDEQQ